MEVKVLLFLKTLEMQGFKTFVDRTRLDFEPGITCIVGPNGSGKSNIVDAIAWVLGEQSARVLRGVYMEDVIFAGSEKRRPVGLAEVTLTLDNGDGGLPLDFPEVAVTRRLTRSGESEYKLNKTPCRLRDIQELFLDTGAGKEKFAIIGQGRLEEILTAHPQERRVFLEEVAGISRYRWRKEQVLKKLAETEQNLVRLKDILQELRLQLDPLEEEAGRARRYLKLQQVLQLVELMQRAAALRGLAARREESARRKELWEEKLADLAREEEGITAALEGKGCEIDEAVARKHSLERELREANARLEQFRAEQKWLSEKLTALTARLDEYTREAASLEEEYSALSGEQERVRRRLEDIGREEGELQGEISRLEGTIEELAVQKNREGEGIARLRRELVRIEEAMAALRDERARLDERRGLEKRDLGTRERELKELEGRHRRLEEQMAAWREELKTLQDRLGALEAEKQTLAGDVDWCEGELRALRGRVRAAEERRHKAAAHVEVLRQARREGGTLGEGVRAVLAAAEEGRLKAAIVGMVAEKITVPAGLEKALDMALGAAAQNILVRTARDAEAAIKFLKETGRGRATFLPLEWLTGRPLPAVFRWILEEDGVLGVAADLVQYTPDLRPAIQYLLGQTIVVKELKQALALAPRLRNPLRLVTLDGDLIHPRGPITGGSSHKRRGILWQTAEARRWEQELEEVEAELTSLGQEEKEKLSTLEESRGRLVRVEREIEGVGSKIHLLVQRLSDGGEECRSLKEKIEERRRELDELVLGSREAAEKEKTLEDRLASLEARRQAVRGELDSRQQELARLEETLRQQQQVLASSRSRLETIKVTARELEANLSSLARRLETLERRGEELRARRDEEGRTVRSLEERQKDLEKSLAGLSASCARLEASLREQEAAVRKIQEERDRLLARREEVSRQLRSLGNRLQREEIGLARLEAALESGYRELTALYGPNWQAKAARPRPHLMKRAGETKARLKAEMEKLGEVNPGVIQEYERLCRRYRELSAEVADLEGGRDTLRTALQEIDSFMAQRLGSTLQAVREAFASLFNELFGGGSADLVVTGEDNLLEAGVEIMARPPGKKSQHLALLSGGEKALTALAFIFALLKVKPRAFCIFDEIDTALDDANVVRFARILRSFAEHTQFIVVSHRQGTMEAADVLYGVTMEEEGVSRLVSVRMEQISA
ncbi:MAG TPA: chromosome segregation protein SMC [Peptococcaceae bacterium]|nr:MAG: Chromosome partition protein Smc [Moorella sp. 60_41]HBT46327.1 chromosome segregation protein SMC [Peptococcaceae bacterium]